MKPRLVLSLFPGIGLLDRAFEEEGFCVVRGPDLLWGGDIRGFHPPAGVFDGVVGGPPCQAHTALLPIIRKNGHRIAPNLIPEYERVVSEAAPAWFVMENVQRAPLPTVAGYQVQPSLLNNRWLGEKQNRIHRFSFGTRDGRQLRYQMAALEHPEYAYRVTHDARSHPVALLAERRKKKMRLPNSSGTALSVAETCELQGMPREFFEHSPFRVEAQRLMLGNAVAYPMARELARAVKRALYENAEVAP